MNNQELTEHQVLRILSEIRFLDIKPYQAALVVYQEIYKLKLLIDKQMNTGEKLLSVDDYIKLLYIEYILEQLYNAIDEDHSIGYVAYKMLKNNRRTEFDYLVENFQDKEFKDE